MLVAERIAKARWRAPGLVRAIVVVRADDDTAEEPTELDEQRLVQAQLMLDCDDGRMSRRPPGVLRCQVVRRLAGQPRNLEEDEESKEADQDQQENCGE